MAEARVVSSDEDVAAVVAEDRAEGRQPATTSTEPTHDDYIRRLFHIESGGNPYNVTGSNRGLAQFGPEEERKYGIDASNRHLPETQARAVTAEYRNNHPMLSRVAGREATFADHYLAHQQGLAGASALLRNPDMPAWQAIRQFYPNDRIAQSAIMGNIPRGSPLKGLDVNQISSAGFVSYWRDKFNQGLPGAATGAGSEAYASRIGGSPEDMSGRYNTPLSAAQTTQFNAWAKGQGLNVDAEKHDYDIQGAWLANPELDLRKAHGTDKFKKPNHPTFSNESQYSGLDGYVGGQWANKGPYWEFEPSEHNLKQHSATQLQGYFDHYEGKNELKLASSNVKQAGLVDWLLGRKPSGPGPGPAEAKGTPPEQADPIKGLIAQTAPRDWPTEEEAEFQAQYNPPGQTGETGRVLGQMRLYQTAGDKKGQGKKTIQSFEPGQIYGLRDLTEAAKTGEDPTKSMTLNLADHPAIGMIVQPMIQQAARASTRSALATLGFNPGRTAIEVSGQRYNVGGLTQPEGEASMWVNASSPSAMVHESIHRGIYMLTRFEHTKDEANKILKKLDDYKPFKVGNQDSEELAVRQIMRTVMGDVESKDPRADTKQIAAAKLMFEDGAHATEATRLIHRLEQMAAESVGRRGGPH